MVVLQAATSKPEACRVSSCNPLARSSLTLDSSRLSFSPFFSFFFNPSSTNRNARPKVVDQREVDRAGPRFMPSNSLPSRTRAHARTRFHLRLSRFDYLLGEAYRLLIYSAVTNYDDLVGQRRYLFPLVRTSGFWWKRGWNPFSGGENIFPAERETTSYR